MPATMGSRSAQRVEMSDPDGFHWVGGHPVADFLNTLPDRGRPKERDLLSSYAVLLRWLVRAGLVSRTRSNELEQLASASPAGAQRVLDEVRELREALQLATKSHAKGKNPPAAATALIGALLAEAGASSRLEWSQGRARRELVPSSALRAPILVLTEAFVGLATSREFAQTKICKGEDCDFVFLDSSPKQDRSWCEMRICGNRAKVKAWRARSRQPKKAKRRP